MNIHLCSVDDFRENNMLEVTYDGHSYLVINIEKEFFVVDNVCSHEDSELILGCIKNRSIRCSLHGSCFDLRTGNPLNEPADEPIKTYKTVLKDNKVYIEI